MAVRIAAPRRRDDAPSKDPDSGSRLPVIKKEAAPCVNPARMAAMMESQTMLAGDVLWAVVMRQATAYLRRMAAENRLDKWVPKPPSRP